MKTIFRPMRRGVWRALLVGLIVVFLGMPLMAVQAQDKTLEWTRLDVDIAVQPNGDLRITETNVIRFTSGTFSFGYRDIDRSRLTSISDITATDGGRSARVETGPSDTGKFRIKYYLNGSAQNETRTLVLSYLVRGATRYYPEGDQVYWAAVFADRNGFAVQNSTVTVRLPNGATGVTGAVYGPASTITGQGESVIKATATERIRSGQEMEVRVQFPHGIITGSAPAWQAAYDKQRAYDEVVKPRNDLLFLVLALLTLLGGPAAIVLLWLINGRDPNTPQVADVLNTPPDMSPGVAGALIDERSDLQDIIATIIDLAKRGILIMKEADAPPVANWMFERGPRYGDRLSDFEQRVIVALGLAKGETVSLNLLKERFYRQIKPLKEALYQELVKQGYYTRSPESTRGLYSGLALLSLLAAGLGCVLSIFLSDLSNYAICFPLGLFATAITAFFAARNMPQRTRAGADMKMRIDAFKRYLQNVERYVDLKSAADQFAAYLPWAVAFGLDKTWVRKFAAVDAPSPDWYVPYGYPYPHYGPYYGPRSGGRIGGAISDGGDGPDIRGAARAPGGVESLNQGLTLGMAGLSGNLTSMFNSVSRTFTSQPQPVSYSSSGSSGGSWGSSSSFGGGGGGGGWSGGGGGGGGSSGGGGGGFG
ncbi:MAG: DUF2207 domain-containing protein [Thermoflexales bacterium]|nr:DUF2207 domain-containing protein [Thermoflexales bacterium]